jgi:uncharacterized membrane protein
MQERGKSDRLLFIDMLRLIAAVQMIQGHTVSALLAPAYKSGFTHALWSFARGLTSVLFLTTAGLAFVLAERRGHDGAARRRRALRAARLIAIGYAMHAPLAPLFGIEETRPLASMLMVDVLQCIGVSLLLLELLSLTLVRPERRALLAGVLGVCCFAFAPATAELHFQGAALIPGQYLTMGQGSLFPLLPWSGYVFLGFALGTVSFRPDVRLTARLAAAGGVTLGVGLLGFALSSRIPPALSPWYAAIKLGCVLLLAAALVPMLASVQRLPSLFARLASESLFLYVSHVVLLYADGVGLAWQLGERHSPPFAIALAALLLVACCGAALGFRGALRSLQRPGRGSTRGAPAP